MTRRGSGPLIDVRTFHAQEAARLQGIQTARERALAQARTRRADPLPERPKEVVGNLDDNTALESLLEVQERQGRIVNKTQRGGQYGLTYYHPAHVNANSPVQRFFTQSAADTTSTTNTVTTVAAMAQVIPLGVGLWSITAKGSVGLTHDASGISAVSVEIDGNEGTARTYSGTPDSGGSRAVASHTVDGLAGERDVTVRVRYRSNTSGTTGAKNPEIDIEARRTE